MFIVRDVLIAKPGSAGKLAKLMKESTPALLGDKVKVMIDYVADFNKIILEHEVENLAAFEKMMEEFKSDPEIRAKMAGYTDLYLTGKREIYKVVD